MAARLPVIGLAWGVKMAIVLVLFTAMGCAFRLSDPDPADDACISDDDCAAPRVCSNAQNVCVLALGEAASFRARGDFDCTVDELDFDGVAVSASWPEFTINGNAIPARDAALTTRCFIGTDGAHIGFQFEGARVVDPFFGAGFYRLFAVFPVQQIAGQGAHEPAKLGTVRDRRFLVRHRTGGRRAGADLRGSLRGPGSQVPEHPRARRRNAESRG